MNNELRAAAYDAMMKAWMKPRDGDNPLHEQANYYYYDERAREVLDMLAPTGNENVAHMREVLKFAEQEEAMPDSRFDMSSWHEGEILGYGDQPACGTTMCLAGTAAWMSLDPHELLYGAEIRDRKGQTIGGTSTRGREYLGFNKKQHELFMLTYFKSDTIRPIMEYMAGEAL